MQAFGTVKVRRSLQAGGRSGQIRARDFERVPAKNRTSFCGRPRARLQLWPRGAWGASVNQRTRCALFPSMSFQIPKQTQTAPLSASARPGQAVGRSPPAPPPCNLRPPRDCAFGATAGAAISEKPGPRNQAAPNFAGRNSLREFRPDLSRSGARAPPETFAKNELSRAGRNSLRVCRSAKFGAPQFLGPGFSENCLWWVGGARVGLARQGGLAVARRVAVHSAPRVSVSARRPMLRCCSGYPFLGKKGGGAISI